jgi:hypothetical protein
MIKVKISKSKLKKGLEKVVKNTKKPPSHSRDRGLDPQSKFFIEQIAILYLIDAIS